MTFKNISANKSDRQNADRQAGRQADIPTSGTNAHLATWEAKTVVNKNTLQN